MARYFTYPVQVNPVILLQRSYTYLKSRMPGWSENTPTLDVWMLEAFTTETTELLDVASRVPDTIFSYFGRNILNLSPIDAAAATTTTTWTAIDTLGHTIPAGTRVQIRNSSGVPISFETVNEVVIPVGSSTTGTGAVTIIADEGGTDGNDLSGTVELQDIVDFVNTIVTVNPTSGGVDAESDADYLNGLVDHMKLLSRRPILPEDFEAITRTVPGVYRAVALDGYDPIGDTFGNERMVAVSAIDANGSDVSTPIKTIIQNTLESLRELNFLAPVFSPHYDAVDVTAQIVVAPKFDPTTTVAAAVAALNSYFLPNNWGSGVGTTGEGPTDPQLWINQQTVRKYDVSQIIHGVDGVQTINPPLTLGKNGGAQTEADVSLGGRISLTTPGTFSITHT